MYCEKNERHLLSEKQVSENVDFEIESDVVQENQSHNPSCWFMNKRRF